MKRQDKIDFYMDKEIDELIELETMLTEIKDNLSTELELATTTLRLVYLTRKFKQTKV